MSCGNPMKSSLSIAVFTRFYPNVGGIETLAETLANEWTTAGHRVTIVTDVAAASHDSKDFAFPVLHRPPARKVLQAVRESDVVVHNNVSLKALWPFLFVRRPYVAVHHGYYHLTSARQPWQEKLKVAIARRWAHNVCVSVAVHQRLGCDGVVIPNLYDHYQFANHSHARNNDLVFVGRLVSEKGVQVLLDALNELKLQGLAPSLTIIGEGPERPNVERRIRELQLEGRVTLVGSLVADAVSKMLNEHRIIVVPSLCHEGFGIVVLEGAACGCVVVGTDRGGLPEAIGPCGVTFPLGDHKRLAAILAELLQDSARLDGFRQAAAAHLEQHRANIVAARYIEFFEQVLTERRQRHFLDRALSRRAREEATFAAVGSPSGSERHLAER